jgi:iron complex outermembrane receptor protein
VLIDTMKRLGLIAAACVMSVSAQAMADDVNKLNIPAGELDAALKALARQVDVEVLYTPAQVKGVHTGGVHGAYSARDAVDLLLKGTPLQVHVDATGVMVVALPVPTAWKGSQTPTGRVESSDASSRSGERLRLAEADQEAFPRAAVGANDSSAASGNSQTPQLAEIVVTATKRSESVEKVPIAIAAYSQDYLDKEDIKSFADIARVTPGVTNGYATGGVHLNPQPAIRGINSGAGASTVGVYIDETPVQIFPDSIISDNPYPKVFDLDRVEVLLGPQGTLYGAGSEGGTIRFITPEPSLTKYSSYVRSDLSISKGGDPSYEFGAAGGGPIVDGTLGFRASAWYRREGGYINRIDWYSGALLDKNGNWNDAGTARLALKWQPFEGLDVTPSIFYQKSTVNDGSTFWLAYSDPGKTRYVSANPVMSPNSDGFTLSAIKLNWDLGAVKLVNNTSFLSRQNNFLLDTTVLDLSAFNIFHGLVPPAAYQNDQTSSSLSNTQNVFTQEVRLQSNSADSRLQWVAGLFYQHSRQTWAFPEPDTVINSELAYARGPGVTVQSLYGIPLYQDTYLLYLTSGETLKEESGFGQVDFKATDKLTLTAGVRVAHHSYQQHEFAAGPLLASNGYFIDTHQADTPVTPKYGVSYQINPDNMVYASAAKGYRQGFTTPAVGAFCNADAQALGISPDERAIKPDFVWSYELGNKSRLWGGRLQVDVSAYWINWKNIQSGFTLPTCTVPTVANLGDAVSKGIDFTIDMLLTEQLQFTLAAGYADAKYTTTTEGAHNAVVRSSGQPLPIPPWQANASLQYDFTVGEHKAYARLLNQVQSHISTPLDYASAATDPAIPRPPAFDDLGARIGMSFGGWDVSLYGDNLANEHPQLTLGHNGLHGLAYTSSTLRPLTIGITGVFHY